MHEDSKAMKKDKILFVGAYPPPYGGIASHLYDLLPQLVNHGYEVVSLTLSQNEKVIKNNCAKNIFVSAKKYFYKNIPFAVIDFIRCLKYKDNINIHNFIKIITTARIINNVCREEHVQAMFVYNNYDGMVIPILRRYFKFNNPIAFMIFGDYYLRPDAYRLISEYVKDVFDKSDVILSSSQYCANSISKVLGYDFPVKVIYVGVDHDTYKPTDSGSMLRAELNIPTTATVFLFMARMVKDMGLDFVIDNASKLLSIDEEIYLIIAGAEGNLSQRAKQVADDYDRIKYCPNVPFEKKIEFYDACNVVIAPTMEKHACMGVSIKEAMACAKPVIASNSGGIPEAIDDGVNGFLIPFSDGRLDAEVFLIRAKQMLNNPKLCKSMGERGREKVLRTFTNDQTTQKYLDVLGKFKID